MGISKLYFGDDQYNYDKDGFIVSVSDRVRFYILFNNVYLVPVSDTRPMSIIYKEAVVDNNINEALDFSKVVKGFIRENEICICKGNNFNPISLDEIFSYWNSLLNAHFEVYHHSEADIALWTGCIIGHDGCLTRPNKLLGKITKFGSFVKCC